MNTDHDRPAEVFHPGEYIRDELQEREWRASDFADITGADPGTLSGVLNGKRSVNVPLAIALGKAFGTSADVWMGLQFQYDHWHATANETNAVERKARLYQFPVREMAKRDWIDDAEPLEDLEQQMSGYFQSFGDLAAKRTGSEQLTNTQKAWLYRTKLLAQCVVDPPPYTKKKLVAAIDSLKTLLHTPEETASVSRILQQAGVRFVVVEGLPGIKLDGACYWLDKKSPVVALTLRFDRIDNFWFVLRHELEHVLRGHAKRRLEGVVPDSVETTLRDDPDIDGQERIANEAASDFCVPHDSLDDFINRWGGYYQRKRIEMFANSLQIHPGLVVGQLHNRKELPHRNLRKILVGIRDYVVDTAMTDGWGTMPPGRLIEGGKS